MVHYMPSEENHTLDLSPYVRLVNLMRGGWVDACHSNAEFGPDDCILGIGTFMGVHCRDGWVGAEGDVDGVADALDANTELQRGE
jgi:hypothetical protein